VGTWEPGSPPHSFNPLNADSSPYVSVTAVPILVSIPENEQTAGTKTFEDPSSWKLDYPSGWIVERGTSEDGLADVTTFANAKTDSALPPGYVRLTIVERPDDPVRDHDSRFPLSLDDFSPLPGGEDQAALRFQGNGVVYEANAMIWSDASEINREALAEVIASIRFPSLQAGNEHAGWTSLGSSGYRDGEGNGTWVGGRIGVGFLVLAPKAPYLLDLVPDTCGEGQDQQWDRATDAIVVTCPTGTQIRYDRYGRPDSSNPAEFQQRLDVHRVVTAWDGTYLVEKAVGDSSLALSAWTANP
jgi:hypothetical protein